MYKPVNARSAPDKTAIERQIAATMRLRNEQYGKCPPQIPRGVEIGIVSPELPQASFGLDRVGPERASLTSRSPTSFFRPLTSALSRLQLREASCRHVRNGKLMRRIMPEMSNVPPEQESFTPSSGDRQQAARKVRRE